MATAIGKMRELIKFQRRSSTPDGFGNLTSVWADLCGPFYARLQPLKGVEQLVDQRLSEISDYMITMGNCSDIATVTAEDRIVNTRTGVTYNITAIQNADERGSQITFAAKSGSAET